MGCRYDHIAVDWLPISCIDKELTQSFDVSGPGPNGSWPYYEVPSNESDETTHLRRLTNDQIDNIAIRGIDYLTTRGWHIQYCMFIWKKQFWAGFNAKQIEPWNNKEAHIQHCSDYIMEAVRSKLDLNTIDTIIPGVNRHSKKH